MIYIGCDPGKKGAVAIIGEGGISCIPFDEKAYTDAFRRFNTGAVCALEHVGAMPGQGVTSMFNFGANFGFIQGCFKRLESRMSLYARKNGKMNFR